MRAYPRWLYKRGSKPILVENKEEERQAIDMGYCYDRSGICDKEEKETHKTKRKGRKRK